MSENRGIFSLEEFYDLQVSGETTNIFEVFRYVNSLGTSATSGGPAYGYLASGFTGTPYATKVTTVDRIDYGNDTATTLTKGPIPTAKSWGDAAGNTSYGYAAGGNPEGSKIDRVDYASDSSTASPKGLLSQARYYLSGAGNADYGYWAGGAGGEYSTIDRKDYASDTTTNSVKGTLTVGKRLFSSGTGNLSYGYFGGGATGNGGPYVSTIERVDYSNDGVTASPKGPLTSARGYSQATGNGNYGYWGGSSPASTPSVSSIDRVDFSNDTATAETKSKFSTGSFGYGAATGSSDYGYFMGGSPQPSGGSNIHRLDYANDTADTVLKGNLSSVRTSTLGAFSGQAEGLSSSATLPVPAIRIEPPRTPGVGSDYGYIAGGGSSSTVDRIDYGNDTATAAPKGPLSRSKQSGSGTGNQYYGYYGGGSPGPRSEVDRIDYPNDTATGVQKGKLITNQAYQGSVGNTNYGYWAGSYPSPSPAAAPTTIARLDFASDSTNAVSKGSLVLGTWVGGTGNLNFGWFGGSGWWPSSTRHSTIQRIQYSNDTATSLQKGPFPAVRCNMFAGAGTADYGYWMGELNGPGSPVSTVDRVDYSSDTSTASPKGPLAQTIKYHGVTASTTHGYNAGGTAGTGVERIDFSNDTATGSPKGPLSSSRYATMGVSSRINGFPDYSPATSTPVDKGAEGYTVPGPLGPAYGYWIAGDGGGSRYHRVDFSNDTGTAGVRGNLDRSMSRHAAVSSMNHAYAAGGWSNTNISRIDYADDTTTAIPKGNLPPISGLSSPAGVDTKDYGYICGGLPLTTVNRIDYANDTATASARGPLSATRRYISATGNQSYGYVIAGTPPDFSSVDRIDYSNDSVTATVKGNLPYTVYGHGATGNADYGYVTGGFNVAPGSNNWISSTSRIDYSNDTATAASKGPLSQPRRNKSTGSASYGWSGGGSAATPSHHSGTSTIDRIDFSNDTATASARGPLSGTRTNLYTAGAQANAKQGSPTIIPRIRWVDSAAENPGTPLVGPAYGYFAGGLTNSQFTTVDRIDFSSDTGTASPKGNLTYARGRGGGAGNTTHGYIFGGAAYSGTSYSYISRVQYSNDTATVSSVSNLSNRNSWYGYAASVGTVDYGYTGGTDNGGAPAYTGGNSILDRLDYANDTTTASARGSGIFNPIGHGYGTTGNSTHGYFGGGYHGTLGTLSSIRRIDYANDTAALASAGPLGGSARYKGATGNANYGYYNVGAAGSGSNGSGIDRLDYSSDTSTATPKGPLSNSTTTNTAATGDTSYGYFGGRSSGYPLNNWYSTVDRIDYANDTATASPKGPLSQQRYSCMAFSGKENGIAKLVPTVLAPVQPPFPFPVQLPAPGPSMGYFAAGSPGPGWNAFSGIDRIQFSNDTATASPKGALTASKYAMSGCGTMEYGYIGAGGQQPGPDFSDTDRIDYSNDTATALARGKLNRAGRSTAAASNTTYGYWAGGMTPYPTATSKVSRLTFASDTGIQVAKGNLTTVRRRWHATGNQSYGYFAGGGGGSGGSRIDRIDYTNDTPTAASKGPLTVSRSGHAAAGNASFGYFINGFAPLETTSVERLDYSSDTTTASPKGPLTSTRAYNTGTGSPDFGYVAGGWTQAYGQISYTDRIEYSNDTATALSKGKLNSNPYRNASVSARAYGLP